MYYKNVDITDLSRQYSGSRRPLGAVSMTVITDKDK